jgi:hypothetical protein
MLPLCFVLMPFGKKALSTGVNVDFDAVFRELIEPAIVAAGMEPLRADQEVLGGIIHKPMFERLILCDFAVADLTGANANVYYELGMRHGIRPSTTVPIFAADERMPFDLTPVRAVPYQLNPDGTLSDVATDRERLRGLLVEAMGSHAKGFVDSPVFQLVEGFRPPDIARLKTDAFRDRAAYAIKAREQLKQARQTGKAAVAAVASSLGNVAHLEAGVVIDVMLSLRAVGDIQGMVDLYDHMPVPLQRSVLVREQLGFALNRLKQSDRAEQVLRELIVEHGASSETNGLLGRVYKDRWERANKAGETFAAAGWLGKAIDTYLQGFEADWRDAYPGVNAVTLMELKSPPDPRRLELLPVVTYAVKRRIAKGNCDYWDHATLLELGVLRSDEASANAAAADALAAVREKWEPETTARNLRLIRESRAARGTFDAWANAIEDALFKRASA